METLRTQKTLRQHTKETGTIQVDRSVSESFCNLANDMEAAGYNEHDVRQIRSKVEHFKDARDIVKNAR